MGSDRTRLPLNTERLAGSKLAPRHRQESRPRCRKRGYDSSFGQIHFPGTESLLRKPSFPDRPRLAYEATQAIVALVSSATDTLITPPFKTWARHGAPALAISFFTLAQSAAPTARKESLSERQNCLNHYRYHPAVPPRTTAGTTMANTTTLSSKFQIAIPNEVREAQGWKSGQEFAFIPKGGGYLLVSCSTIQDLRCIAKGATVTNCRDRKGRD